MYKVRILDAKNESRQWDFDLGFDPRLSPYLRMRDRPNSARTRTFRVVADKGVSDIVTEDVVQSQIIVYVEEIDS
jgi:hypothetical protein